MNIIGIFMEGPNTGACLFKQGKLIAMVEEERFTRQKGASESFPSQSIAYCLREGGIRLRDVQVVALGWDHGKYPEAMDLHMRAVAERNLDPLADVMERIIHDKLSPPVVLHAIEVGLHKIDTEAAPKIVWYPHHRCHAASVHYLSGFDDSAILVIDGSGEEVSTSTWHGFGDEISQIDEWKLPDSIGWFYAAVTEWLGFKAYSGEGKVMGLAAYGRPDEQIGRKLRQFLIPEQASAYRLDPTYVYYGPRTYSKKFTDRLVELLGPPRLPESELSDYHVAVAYETQHLLEAVATDLARRLLERTGSSRLCISGGVAMNCKMNGVLSNLRGVSEVFINPASHDSGTALGAALLAVRDQGMSPRQNVLTHAYWGPSFSDDEIEPVLEHCGLRYQRCDDIAGEVARRLTEGQIIGWFQHRAEFGARALGARSILANPQIADMKNKINARVKYREGFRPFAPSMVEEVKDRYMVNPKASPFMILAYPFKEGFREAFPSIVHVDGSVRPQTVSRTANPLYWNMIKKFGEMTGHPIVLNTSFNVRGEPIVGTPLDALRCFYSTGMDALALGSFLVTK